MMKWILVTELDKGKDDLEDYVYEDEDESILEECNNPKIQIIIIALGHVAETYISHPKLLRGTCAKL